MRPIAANFRAGAPISQVPASWFNAVAKFINSLVPGRGISWPKSDGDIRPIEVDGNAVFDMLKQKVENKIDEKMTTTAPAAAPQMTSGRVGDLSVIGTDRFTAGAPGGTGAVIYILCRSGTSGTDAGLFLRPFTITSDGRIWSIGQEDAAQAVAVLQST